MREVARKKWLTLEAFFEALAMRAQSCTTPPSPASMGKKAEVQVENNQQQSARRKSWADEVEEQETLDSEPIVVVVEKAIEVEKMVSEAEKQEKEEGVAVENHAHTEGGSIEKVQSNKEVTGVEVVGEQVKSNTPVMKSYYEIVIGNRAGDVGLALQFVPVGGVVEITEAEWEEGAQIWEHTVMGMVVSHKPSYAEMMRWVEVNWKAYVTQMKPGVFLFQFKSEAEKMEVLGKHWTFYHKFQMVVRS